ncbi:hypothetical protein RND71_031097 [Anisodus tanguticus]|uniref:Uncharacterized protein n=1 Tax=Anisodus tanguticus TaxID=243964 RepID=A0AAE1RCK6_9SOLA|nr:hypothetical protein RND71_031097 [Anisodus tanguticus]
MEHLSKGNSRATLKNIEQEMMQRRPVKHEEFVDQVKKQFTKISAHPTTTSELVANFVLLGKTSQLACSSKLSAGYLLPLTSTLTGKYIQ